MTTIDEYFRVGETVTLGAHTFGAEEIKTFARKFDPQPFHVDEEAAKGALFGRLCASGWHTVATWMKYNLLHRESAGDMPWDGPGPRPQFGPSPGFEKLRWLKPVYAGETVTYTRRATGHRALTTRPGWRMLTMTCEAFDSTGDKVLEFESLVLIRTG